MLEKIYTFLDDDIRHNDGLKLIVFGVLAIILFIISMVYVVDYTPATDSEYAPLINQCEEISKDFNIVYSYDNYKIAPDEKSNNILVTLSNEQCELICSFDNQLKFITKEKCDKAYSIFKAILFSIWLFSLVFNYAITAILTVIIPLLLSLLLKLLEKICLLLI